MRKRISKKGFISGLLCIVIVLTYSIGAYAYVYNGKKAPGGPFNKYYYFINTDSTYTNLFKTGFSRWNAARKSSSAVCSFYETSSYASSHVDCYMFKVNEAINGYAETYPLGQQPYSWAEVVLNTLGMGSNPDSDYGGGVVCHELGHVLGLADNNSSKNVIMCQEGSGRAVRTPQADDIDGVYNRY